MSTRDDVLVVDKHGNTVRGGGAVQIENVTPIIVDLGTRSRKAIRRLKEGRGELMAEIGETVSQVRSSLGEEGKNFVPVVILYRKRDRARISTSGGLSMIPPFNFFR